MLLPVAKPGLPDLKRADGALALQKIWRNKDTLSPAYEHDLDRLFADTRKHQKLFGHPVVNPQKRKSSRRKA